MFRNDNIHDVVGRDARAIGLDNVQIAAGGLQERNFNDDYCVKKVRCSATGVGISCASTLISAVSAGLIQQPSVCVPLSICSGLSALVSCSIIAVQYNRSKKKRSIGCADSLDTVVPNVSPDANVITSQPVNIVHNDLPNNYVYFRAAKIPNIIPQDDIRNVASILAKPELESLDSKEINVA